MALITFALAKGRLGNKIVVRCQRLQDNEDVNLGDYYSEDGKDFIVAKTTTKYFSNYKIVTSYLSPNFLQKNVVCRGCVHRAGGTEN